MFLTGFIEHEHTIVPGPDGKFGYGGKCFPPNISSFYNYLYQNSMRDEHDFIKQIDKLNIMYRNK